VILAYSPLARGRVESQVVGIIATVQRRWEGLLQKIYNVCDELFCPQI
jgi:hypothetical protein